MRKPTPLKLAIVASGVTQRHVAQVVGIDETLFSRIVNGLHCDDGTQASIAQALERTVDELWPPATEAAA